MEIYCRSAVPCNGCEWLRRSPHLSTFHLPNRHKPPPRHHRVVSLVASTPAPVDRGGHWRRCAAARCSRSSKPPSWCAARDPSTVDLAGANAASFFLLRCSQSWIHKRGMVVLNGVDSRWQPVHRYSIGISVYPTWQGFHIEQLVNYAF